MSLRSHFVWTRSETLLDLPPSPGAMIREADLFTPPAPGAPTDVTASHRSFYNNVQRRRPDVQTIAPILGGRTFAWAELAKFVTSAKPATN